MITEPIKFLLVDDIEENLLVLEALLRRDDLQILKATSGAEALELLLVHDVALAFLDVQMPDMNGFELAELMRGTERTKHVPIIFVTAGARDPQRVFKGYETGAVDFLFKPIDPRILKSKADVFFELHRQRTECTRSLKLNEMFVGILSHDLRNPLSALMMGVNFLEEQTSEDVQQRALDRMRSAGRRMSDMIEQLLDLTRARLGGGLGFVRARKVVNVADLVQRTLDELKIAHPERVVALEQRGDCNTVGDADRLMQLFSNVIANAMSHGAADAPITISVLGAETEIIVDVRNKGMIPADILPTIFDPFRGKQTNSASSSTGLGLGLYIAQQIAVAHDGNVQANSTEADGTTLSITLPRRAMSTKLVNESVKTVMIVDEDENSRESLRTAFDDAGYGTLVAVNGREALDQMTQGGRRPDVVVMDIVVPVIGGRRLYEAMQTDPNLVGIPVIVSTSDATSAPSGTIVMSKPVRLSRLLATVAQLVQTDG